MKRFNYFLLSLMACLFLGVGSVFALDRQDVDFGALKIGKEYKMQGDNYFYGTFTPSENGYLQVVSNSTTTLRPFIKWQGDAKSTMALADNGYNSLRLFSASTSQDDGGYTYELKVAAGTTYYLCASTMTGDDVTVSLQFAKSKTVEYLGCSENENAVVSPTGSSSVSFKFNRPVKASAAVLFYGDNKEVSVTSRSVSSVATVTADLKETLINLVNQGVLKEGDAITVLMKNVKEDADDVEEGEKPIVYGDVSIKLTVGKVPAMLVSATFDGVPVTANTKFLTWYPEGSGKLVLTFSKELKTNSGDAQLFFGDMDQAENGGYYKENNDEKAGNFTMKIQGNQVILDFSGKRRAVNDMVSSTESNRGADFTKINLQISRITDKSGVRAYSTSSKTAGRFNYSFTLDVPEANVSSDFTPANGASIKNAKDVEIWISDEQSLSYQGVVFTYDLKENGIEPTPDADGNVDIIKEVVVDKADIQRVDDPDEEGAVILTVPVPEEVKNMNNVTVSLYKVTCVDGKDYTNIIAAKYNVVATGIDNISVEASKAMKVYNLNGQLVREGKSLDGLHGIYVVDGKKIVLK